ncbi:protein zyg-11 homolog B-like [Planococcus citri]|uniref:protein zyg-11 homolog B-like n=1 Tax=Planococcus citri TaxID=170843 RepID=UPI0031F7B1B0
MDVDYFPRLTDLSLDAFLESLRIDTIDLNNVLAFSNSVFLPEQLSETLITKMSAKNLLNHQTISLFEPTNTRLRKISIPDASSAIDVAELQIFQKHKLKEIRLGGLQITIDTLVDSLNEWTRLNLEKLSVSKAAFPLCFSERYLPITSPIITLKNLRELDLSETNLNLHLLDVIVEELPLMESLNISNTGINDLSCLLKCKSRLKTLIMSNVFLLPSNCNDEMLDHVFFHLDELRHLDISFEKFSNPVHIITAPDLSHTFPITHLVDKLPKLVSLDISGNESVSEDVLIAFLQSHENLKFFGLLDTGLCNSDVFLNTQHFLYRPDLLVTGSASLDQIVLSLKLYSKRTIFLQSTLYNLYSSSDRKDFGPRPDLVKIMTDVMKTHSMSFKVQLACTACLYNLTKSGWFDNDTFGIPSTLMTEVAHLILNAMSTFAKHPQLQKNALLTLCNDRMLQNTNMDRYRCARLVLDALCRFTDEATQRLCVAISSIVVARISTDQMNELGSEKRYMQKLLALVKRKLDIIAADPTLGYALSTLWNITDESPQTCTVFLEQGGLELFTKMLDEYVDCDPVLTKILGLLNNIAEFADLRSCLMTFEVINPIRNLLGSASIENSYFSAGILANLISPGPQVWTIEKIPRDDILIELSESISRWKHIEGEMVAYRSFRPFLPLLNCYETYQAQLWALWAVQHVLTVNASRYYRMVLEEKLCDIFMELIQRSDTNPLVKQQAEIILHQLHEYGRKKITVFKF